MARITEKVKMYIHQDSRSGDRFYCVSDISDNCSWLSLLGTVDVVIEYDEADLATPHAAQLNKAEQELETHRAESALKERQLLDRVNSLRASLHLDGDQ